MGRSGRGVAAAVVVLLAAIPVAPVAADPADVRRAEQVLGEARSRHDDAGARLRILQRRAEIAIEDHNQARSEADAVRAEVTEVVTTLGTIQARVRRGTSSAGDFARRLYQHGAAYELEALLGAGDALEVQTRLVYLRSAAQAQLNVVSLLKADREVELAQLSRLAEVEAEAVRAEAEARRTRAAVEQLLDAQRSEVQRLEREREAAELAQADAERAEAERIARERAEAERRERERLAREAAAAGAAAAARALSRAAGPAVGSDAGRIAVDAALSQLGKPYRWGAAGPDAYDCSGLTSWAWAHAGVHLPHSSRMQYAATQRVTQAEAQPGDLIFFGSPIHHVGMYIGDGRMVEAPYTGAQVRLNDAFVRSDIVGIGRPVD